MNSINDYTIFNSVNPDALTPKATKPLPFPLENFDQQIGVSYDNLCIVLTKLEAAEKNPVNNTPARKRRLKSLKYKTKTAMQLVREVSASVTELWF
jgi:hypothetical protein